MFKQGEFREIEQYSTIPPPFVIMQRITVGLAAILGRLNATANWRRIALELSFGGEPATPLGEAEAASRGGCRPDNDLVVFDDKNHVVAGEGG